MADVIALFAAALIVVAGGFAAAVLARSVRRRKILAAKDRPRRLRSELDGIDDYIRRLGQAAHGCGP